MAIEPSWRFMKDRTLTVMGTSSLTCQGFVSWDYPAFVLHSTRTTSENRAARLANSSRYVASVSYNSEV